MIVDVLLMFMHYYGIFIVLSFTIAKLILLIWYKPHRPSYALKNFFNYYGKYSMRDDKMDRWEKFKSLHNSMSIMFYIAIMLWIISNFIFFSVKHK